MKLNYKQLGEGQPMVILHGLFGSLDNWMSLAKNWSEHFTIYLVDQRNHGQSPHTDQFNYHYMAEDLSEFIEQHKLNKPIILGHSMGGKTAMEFAVNYPNQLDKLIVVDIAPVSYRVHHYDIIDALESLPLSTISSRKEADELLSKKIKELGVRQFLLKNLYWKEKGQLNWRFNLDVLRDQIVPISEFAISNKKYSGPTLFVKGAKSEYILKEYSKNIESKFSNYQIAEINGAGHWVHAEKPVEFSELIVDFIS